LQNAKQHWFLILTESPKNIAV